MSVYCMCGWASSNLANRVGQCLDDLLVCRGHHALTIDLYDPVTHADSSSLSDSSSHQTADLGGKIQRYTHTHILWVTRNFWKSHHLLFFRDKWKMSSHVAFFATNTSAWTTEIMFRFLKSLNNLKIFKGSVEVFISTLKVQRCKETHILIFLFHCQLLV